MGIIDSGNFCFITPRGSRSSHRGIYMRGNTYMEKDTVIYANNLYYCQKNSPSQKPGSGDEWILVGTHSRKIAEAESRRRELIGLAQGV